MDDDLARAARLPLDEQAAVTERVLRGNPVLVEVLARAARLAPPGWYLAAGAVVQTIWNAVTGRPPGYGIADYDLLYFDATDLSWAAEDAVIARGGEVFADLGVDVQIRNEARVHLWYEEKFGVPCAPFPDTETAIASFQATTCAIAVREEPDGRWRIHAPYGLTDAYALRLRPNPLLAPPEVYARKVARWTTHWPELTVLPWPEPSHDGQVRARLISEGRLLGAVRHRLEAEPVDHENTVTEDLMALREDERY